MEEKGSIFELEKYIGVKPQILIGDNGGQYTNLIKKRVEQLGVRAKIVSGSISRSELEKEIRDNGAKGLIWGGGPDSVYDENAPYFDDSILDLDIPYLGICYGMGLLTLKEQGTVKRKAIREDGPRSIHSEDSQLIEDLDQIVLMSHGDSVDKAPDGYRVTSVSQNGLVAAIENLKKRRYGVQFHPEVDDTPNGAKIMSKFLYDVCGCEENYTIKDRIDNSVRYIKEKVGQDKALVLASGGVDSTVALTLAVKAIGPENVYVIHVDNGFMREGESEEVYRTLVDDLKIREDHVRLVKAAEQFYNATTIIDGEETLPLNQVIDPEVKRNIIGDTFVDVVRQQIEEIGLNYDNTFLIQGSLYTDLIESGVDKASKGKTEKIKTHHNATKKMIEEWGGRGRLIEPNGLYYKDDVRRVGSELLLPDKMVQRHPYPGPGLAIRILCGEKPYMQDYSDVNSELRESVGEFGAKPHDYRYNFAAQIVPIQTVGVQGDGRTYDYLALLAGGYQSDLGYNDWEFIRNLAKHITDHNRRINRVAYLIGREFVPDLSEPERYIPTHLTEDVIETCRKMHSIGDSLLQKYDLMGVIAQNPFVLFNVDLNMNGERKRTAAIRGLLTSDWMTGMAALPSDDIPAEFFWDCYQKFMELLDIGAVVIDITNKPPGTTEWE